jgi:superfamily II DNA helicase RecQ
MFIPSCFALLIAPPAWGKTRLFHRWLSEEPRPYIYVSPLRALADEVLASLPSGVFGRRPEPSSAQESWRAWAQVAGAKVMVVTPELLVSFDWEGLARESPRTVVVWDEVHLVGLWGESFRPAMLEAWWGFCASGLAGVGLTATLDAACDDFLRRSLEGVYETLLVGDAGNFAFQTPPAGWLWGPPRWIEQLLDVDETDPRPALIFCAHRQEVDDVVARLTARGLRALGCKGGETPKFRARLGESDQWDFLVSTSCLSHGVNLPSLRRVIFLYPEKNPTLFHQMCTRGGRRGEPYQVACPWGVGVNFARMRAFRSLAIEVMMLALLRMFEDWWYGTRGHRHTGHPPERARLDRQALAA